MSKKKKESASAIEAEVQQSMDAAVDGQSGEEHDKAAAKKVKKDKKRREKNGLVDTFATGMAVDANGVDGQMASQADASQIQSASHLNGSSSQILPGQLESNGDKSANKARKKRKAMDGDESMQSTLPSSTNGDIGSSQIPSLSVPSASQFTNMVDSSQLTVTAPDDDADTRERKRRRKEEKKTAKRGLLEAPDSSQIAPLINSGGGLVADVTDANMEDASHADITVTAGPNNSQSKKDKSRKKAKLVTSLDVQQSTPAAAAILVSPAVTAIMPVSSQATAASTNGTPASQSKKTSKAKKLAASQPIGATVPDSATEVLPSTSKTLSASQPAPSVATNGVAKAKKTLISPAKSAALTNGNNKGEEKIVAKQKIAPAPAADASGDATAGAKPAKLANVSSKGKAKAMPQVTQASSSEESEESEESDDDDHDLELPPPLSIEALRAGASVAEASMTHSTPSTSQAGPSKSSQKGKAPASSPRKSARFDSSAPAFPTASSPSDELSSDDDDSSEDDVDKLAEDGEARPGQSIAKPDKGKGKATLPLIPLNKPKKVLPGTIKIGAMPKMTVSAKSTRASTSGSTSNATAGPSKSTRISRMQVSSARESSADITYDVSGIPKVPDSVPKLPATRNNAVNEEALQTKWLKKPELAFLIENEGLYIKTGKFSRDEDLVLRRAIEDWRLEQARSEGEMIELIATKRGRLREEDRLFWTAVAGCIPERSLQATYDRIRRMMSPSARAGPWTPDEDALLVDAVAQMGTKWKDIGEIVGRWSHDCRDRWRQSLKDAPTRKRAAWSAAEDRELLTVVAKMKRARQKEGKEIDLNDPDADTKQFWQSASLQLRDGSRTAFDCRLRFQTALTGQENDLVRDWTKRDTYLLVERMAAEAKHGVQTSADVKWTRVRSDESLQDFTKGVLQNRWHKNQTRARKALGKTSTFVQAVNWLVAEQKKLYTTTQIKALKAGTNDAVYDAESSSAEPAESSSSGDSEEESDDEQQSTSAAKRKKATPAKKQKKTQKSKSGNGTPAKVYLKRPHTKEMVSSSESDDEDNEAAVASTSAISAKDKGKGRAIEEDSSSGSEDSDELESD